VLKPMHAFFAFRAQSSAGNGTYCRRQPYPATYWRCISFPKCRPLHCAAAGLMHPKGMPFGRWNVGLYP
jgi:hypothetical protein